MYESVKKISGIFLITFLLFPFSLFAQPVFEPPKYTSEDFQLNLPNPTTPENWDQDSVTLDVPVSSIAQSDVKSGEIASCFDYYTFGNVDINLSTDFSSYENNRPALIRGTITNKNTYPLVGLDIKARLVKDIPSPDYFRSDIIVLDEFDIVDNITLDANAELDVSSSLLLPLNTPSGEYQLFLYAVEQDRFNMSGLSFTNDIVASKLSFTVSGTRPDHVYLDQTQITVGDQPHNVMAFMTQHKPNTQVPVKIPLYNPDSENVEMTVTYNLYSWDSANPSNRLETKTEQVIVPANEEVLLTYIVENTSLPVYYLSIQAEPTVKTKNESVFKQKTVSNIRFAIDELSKPRLNFVGVNSYPLKKNTEATLVTCFHNTSNSIDLNNTRIETIVYDQDNKEISRIEYLGKIVPDISAVIQKFTPTKDIVSFNVVSKMYDKNNQLIDSVDKKYDCKDINSSLCPQSKPLTPFMFIAIIGIIAGLGILVYRRKITNIPRV